jgi:hypothetical protein
MSISSTPVTYRDRLIVCTAARNNVAITQYGHTLDRAPTELDSKLVPLWMNDRQARQFRAAH